MADITEPLPVAVERPRPRTHGVPDWLRANLFGGIVNTVLTVIAVALLAFTIPPLIRWGLVDAVWNAPNGPACRAGGGHEPGACWAFIAEKARFIIFGRFPYAEQWRPLLVVVIFLAMLLASCDRRLWGQGRSLSWRTRIAIATVSLPITVVLVIFLFESLFPSRTLFRDILNFGNLGEEFFIWILRKIVMFTMAVGIAYVIPLLWGRWLVLIWLCGLIAVYLLMQGGVLGMTYVETALWSGLPLTLIFAVLAMAFAFPLAILLALGRRSELPAVRVFCVGYIELVRGVPLITVLFMASVMLPLFLPTGFTIDKYLRAQVAFILFAAAYLAEVIRGGLQAIPKGQIEAADSLGLGYWRRTRLIVLPQALSLVIPPLVNNFIGAFKNTSLVIIIGLFDLLGTANAALADPNWQGFAPEAYIFTAAIYFCFCFFMSRYSQMLEREFSQGRQR
jgi:general L-amino acid transport system permease protein